MAFARTATRRFLWTDCAPIRLPELASSADSLCEMRTFTNVRIMKNKPAFLFLSSLLILVDQFSKYFIRQSGGFYVCNPNIAFGIELPLTLICSFGIVILISLCLFQSPNSKIQISNEIPNPKSKFLDLFNCKLEIGNSYPVIFILSGGISNMIDRISYGCVTDFIDLIFWPIFNLADVFIVAGVIIILTSVFRKKAI